MKDLITISCLGGAVSFFYKNIINHIIYYFGLTTFLYRVEAASLVLPLSAANTFYGMIIGFFTDLILLSWIALVIAYVLKTTGRDYGLIKGAFVGASSWLVIYGFSVHTGILGLFKPSGITPGITSLFFDITSGIVSSAVILYLDRRVNLH